MQYKKFRRRSRANSRLRIRLSFETYNREKFSRCSSCIFSFSSTCKFHNQRARIFANISAKEDKFSAGDGRYQLFQWFRARLAAHMTTRVRSFWMIQADTIWRQNLFDVIGECGAIARLLARSPIERQLFLVEL